MHNLRIGSDQSELVSAHPSSVPKPGADLKVLLRLIWPNHDRHGGGATRIPSLREARAVVQVAVTIVQWYRDDWVVQRR